MSARAPGRAVRFGPFRLDAKNVRLWHDEKAVRITPKAFAVLDLLVSRAGQLVSKDDLLSEIWPDVTVSEAALTVCIREIRGCLRDHARRPRFIQTVHRHGFRFIGEVAPDREAPEATGRVSLPTLVGRDAEIARLHAWFARARGGERQVVFVTGEAGIGKTTLVEVFLATLTDPRPWIARGQCIEYVGAGEAYLPVLDALGRLGGGAGSEHVVRLLSRHAPNWLAQMPGLARRCSREPRARPRRAGSPDPARAAVDGPGGARFP